MANRKYTPEHINFITDNIRGCSFKELANMFNSQFGMNLKVTAMISLADRHGLHNGRDCKFNKGWEPTQFKKGQVPWNKGKKGLTLGGVQTQFKKGNKAHNWVPLCTERISKDGYIEVKVQDGKLQKNWKGKHILIWEQHNGPMPKGRAVIFGDGNNRNFNSDNLILVSRKQLAVLNKNKLIQNDTELTRTAVIMTDLILKIGERKRGPLDETR